MTTEEKALALVNAVQAERNWPISKRMHRGVYSFDEALCRAIEAHEADKAMYEQRISDQAKAFSDAVKEAVAMIENGESYNATDQISPFILPEPEPDPLVEIEDPIDALVELLAPVLTHSQGMAARERENRFRNAIAALKAKEADNGKSC